MDGPIQRILIFIDGTEESITAAEYAILLARTMRAELTGAYIINTRALGDLVKARIFLKEEQDEYQRDIEADADRYMNHFLELARKKGVHVEVVKTSGNVSQEIKRLVIEKNIDLLVLGEISQIRSRRDEFYNEAERAMRSVDCSVLVVKDEERIWDLFDAD
jgi:nucleotide-binding universal stress UspA family protein